MKNTMIKARRFWVTIFLLCATAGMSSAHRYVEAHLQSKATDPHGNPSALVYVTLYEHSRMADGTELNVNRGSAMVTIGNYKGQPLSSKCAQVRLGSAEFYTHPTSPECAAVWLAKPGADSMVMAAIELALSQKNAVADRLLIEPEQTYISISMNSRSNDLDGAEVDIYDASGKLMDAHYKVQGHSNSAWYTMSVAGFPPGPYKAVLRKKDGQTIESLFVLN